MTNSACFVVGIAVGAMLTAGAGAASTEPQDAAKLAPQMYHVIFENNQFRVIDYHLQPGRTEPMHSHPNGVLVYSFSDAKMRATSAEGKSSDSVSRAGDVVWRDPVTHRGENIGNTEAHSLLVEPKTACK
jgi:quercetin dioxygenase-like cupin family protein